MASSSTSPPPSKPLNRLLHVRSNSKSPKILDPSLGDSERTPTLRELHEELLKATKVKLEEEEKEKGKELEEVDNVGEAEILRSPEADAANDLADALEQMVLSSASGPDSIALYTLHPTASVSERDSWYRRFIKTLHRFAATHHYGNYVVVSREKGKEVKKKWEDMPFYVRLGMHLLFFGPFQTQILLHWSTVSALLQSVTIRQGRIYDSSRGTLRNILDFVKEYDIDLEELEQKNLRKYKTFNEFFSRKLKKGARKIDGGEEDETVLTSCSDSRLVVYDSIEATKEFWVKGSKFSLSSLVKESSIISRPEFANGASVAIFRLAPSDYHRFHSPINGTLETLSIYEGEYFTVNPQAINEDLDVLTENRRDVLLVEASIPQSSSPTNEDDTPTNDAVTRSEDADGKGGENQTFPVVLVPVGAMLVGSIIWTKSEKGSKIAKGEELGYFKYGGSTVVALFPSGQVQWDEDLLTNSRNKLETVVKMGERIGAIGKTSNPPSLSSQSSVQNTQSTTLPTSP